MARIARLALDLTLSSIIIARPAIVKIWLAAKTKLCDTKAKALVNNDIVKNMEDSLSRLTTGLVSNLENMRNQQLPAERKYLEDELDKVKKKMIKYNHNYKIPEVGKLPEIEKLPALEKIEEEVTGRGGGRRKRGEVRKVGPSEKEDNP